jgi:hypothetical protein
MIVVRVMAKSAKGNLLMVFQAVLAKKLKLGRRIKGVLGVMEVALLGQFTQSILTFARIVENVKMKFIPFRHKTCFCG